MVKELYAVVMAEIFKLWHGLRTPPPEMGVQMGVQMGVHASNVAEFFNAMFPGQVHHSHASSLISHRFLSRPPKLYYDY
jgi:hypothetical protein